VFLPSPKNTSTPSREKVFFTLLFKTLIFIELRRKVPIGKVAALTLSKDPESSEMVIHVSDDWDFRFKSNK
jgi:hypothetical protein